MTSTATAFSPARGRASYPRVHRCDCARAQDEERNRGANVDPSLNPRFTQVRVPDRSRDEASDPEGERPTLAACWSRRCADTGFRCSSRPPAFPCTSRATLIAGVWKFVFARCETSTPQACAPQNLVCPTRSDNADRRGRTTVQQALVFAATLDVRPRV